MNSRSAVGRWVGSPGGGFAVWCVMLILLIVTIVFEAG